MLDLLESFVQKRDYHYIRMDGATAIASRQPLIARFNTVSLVPLSVCCGYTMLPPRAFVNCNVYCLNSLCHILSELLMSTFCTSGVHNLRPAACAVRPATGACAAPRRLKESTIICGPQWALNNSADTETVVSAYLYACVLFPDPLAGSRL